MAVYEYRCRTCDELFEVRRPMSASDDPVDCPSGHAETVRLLSVFASAGMSAATGPGALSSAPPPAGGCGAGCGCAR